MSTTETDELIARVKAARDKVESRRQQRAVLDDRRKQFMGDLASFKESLESRGIDAASLDGQIAKAEADLTTKLQELEALLAVPPIT